MKKLQKRKAALQADIKSQPNRQVELFLHFIASHGGPFDSEWDHMLSCQVLRSTNLGHEVEVLELLHLVLSSSRIAVTGLGNRPRSPPDARLLDDPLTQALKSL